jgi:hypothetical protein
MAIIRVRRDLAAAWTAVNPILALGEMGREKDTGNVKIGDGVSPWSSLPYGYDKTSATASSSGDAPYWPTRLIDLPIKTRNVKDAPYFASGSAFRTIVVGTLASGSTTATVANSGDFAIGQGICIPGAGVAGVNHVGVVTGVGTGQVSFLPATAVVVSKTSTYVYRIKKHFHSGTDFTLGEVIGVAGVPGKLADQGVTRPVFTNTPVSSRCFYGAGNSVASLSNYADIPANWILDSGYVPTEAGPI